MDKAGFRPSQTALGANVRFLALRWAASDHWEPLAQLSARSTGLTVQAKSCMQLIRLSATWYLRHSSNSIASRSGGQLLESTLNFARSSAHDTLRAELNTAFSSTK